MLFVFTMVGYVFASLFQAPQETRVNEPAILGSFIMAVDVNDVVDLYAWQVVIAFNSEELMVLKVFPGDFLGVDSPFFVNASDVDDGILLLGGTLFGDVQGKSGSGGLAKVVFGFYSENYEMPQIVSVGGCFETFLLNSSLSGIPIEDGMLTLSVAGNC